MKRRAVLTVLGVLFGMAVRASGQPTTPDDPLSGLATLLFLGRPAEARTKLSAVLLQAQQSSDTRREAVCHYFIGMAESQLGNRDEALRQLEEARKAFVRLDDSTGQSMALFGRAQLEQAAGKHAETVAALEQALDLIDEVRRSNKAFSYESWLVMGVAVGAPPEVLPFPAETLKPYLMQMLAALSRAMVGWSFVELGQFEKAETELARATVEAQPFLGALDAIIDAAYGDLRRRQWRFDDARDHYRQALHATEALTMLPVLPESLKMEILLRLVEIELLSGQFEDALRWSERALTLVQGIESLRRWRVGILHHRGIAQLRANRFDDAAAVLTEALQVAAGEKDAYREATIRTDLAVVQFLRGKSSASLPNLEKAIALLQKIEHPKTEQSVWITLAAIHLMLNPRDKSRPSFEKLHTLASKSGFRLAGSLLSALESARSRGNGSAPLETAQITLEVWGDRRQFINGMVKRALSAPAESAPGILASMALGVRGGEAHRRGDLTAARQWWSDAAAVETAPDLRGDWLAGIGRMHWLQDDREEAFRFVTQAIEGIGAIGDPAAERRLTASLGVDAPLYFETVIEALVAQGQVEQSFEAAERARAHASRDILRIDPVDPSFSSIARDATVLRTQLLEHERQGRFRSLQIPFPVQAEDAARGRTRYEALLSRLESADSASRPRAMTIEAVREKLPEDATLVSYFVSRPPGAHAWIVDREHVEHVMLPLAAEDRRRIECWASPSRACTAAASAEEAFDRLMSPLLAKVRGRRLVIVAHGVLRNFPFAALRNGVTKRNLSDDYALTCASAASRLDASRRTADEERCAGTSR